MINPPSTFGQPEAAAPAPEPEAEPTRKPRTVVIAAVTGVVALGVLGGAAALVLSGGDDDPTFDAAPAPAVVEPSPEPSTAAVVEPLPVSAVRSRNIFVPLVEEASDTEAADAEAADADAAAKDDAKDDDQADPGTTSGSGGGSTRVVVDQAALEALRASEERVTELQREIADLTTRLEDEGDDSELEDQLKELQEDYAERLVDIETLKEQLNAEQVVVKVVEVDSDSAAYEVTLLVDDEEKQVDLDPATEDVLDHVVLGTTGTGDPITLEYLGYVPEDVDQGTDEAVSLRFVAAVFTLPVGGEMYFHVG